MTKILLTAIFALVTFFLLRYGRKVIIAIGKSPKGERLERCKLSPQWNHGTFKNAINTPQITSNEGFFPVLRKFLFGKSKESKPNYQLPVVKTSLKDIDKSEEICVWLGHSSLFVQTGGVRFLFDPVLTNTFPVNLFMKPFQSSYLYTPNDIPETNFLIITHNHWDHLDYETVKSLKNKIGKVICSLGIGETLEFWGFEKEKIIETDWNEIVKIGEKTSVICLPARHFSGRLFGLNKTLWASFLIDGKKRVFVSGDGGYDSHFKEIGERFPNIDIAVMENGQYDLHWHYTHLLPEDLQRAVSELNPKKTLTYHNSKFALANHSWHEPLDKISEYSKENQHKILTPKIGEIIDLDDDKEFEKWW